MKILHNIAIAATILAINACSPVTTITHTQSKESRLIITDNSNVELQTQLDTLQTDNIYNQNSAETLGLDSVMLQPEPIATTNSLFPIEVTHKIELIDIPQFSTEQSSRVMISEFRQQALFKDNTLNLGELHDNFHYPADGHITSDFGWRGSRMHNGIDIKAYYKDNIYAAFDGVVRVAMYNGGFGNCIVIRHYNGLETVYAHATKMLVKVNDKVKAGDVIALAGRTGRSTGVHLHFEVRVLGQCINPNLVLDTTNRTLKSENLHLTMRNGRIFGSNSDDEEVREAEIKKALAKRYYVVKSGDTLSQIAQKNKTTVTRICALNNISSRSILKIGQRLRIK